MMSLAGDLTPLTVVNMYHVISTLFLYNTTTSFLQRESE